MFWQGRPTFLICLLTYEIQYNAEMRWLDPSTDPDDVLERRIRSDIREVLRLLRDIQGVNQRTLATLATRLRSFRSAFFRAMRNDAGRALRARRIEHIEPENHAAYQHEMISQTLLGTSIVSATQGLADSLPLALRRVWQLGEILGEMFFPSSSHRLAGDIPNPRRQLLEIDAIGRKLAVTWPGMRNLQTSDDPTESKDELVSRLDRLLEEIPEALALWWCWPAQPIARPRTECGLIFVKPDHVGTEIKSGNPPHHYYVPTARDVDDLTRIGGVDGSGMPVASRIENLLADLSPGGVEPLRNLGVPALLATIKKLRTSGSVGMGTAKDAARADVMKREVFEGDALLKAMKQLGARSLKTRKTLGDIVEAAFKGEGRDPDNFKKAMSLLRKQGLVGAKKGRRGGYWLTHDGHAKASKKKKK